MLNFLKIHKISILLWLLILVYIVYFSYLSILRYKTLYASYYDLGIMNQTVFNTYAALRDGDLSRILELTDPLGPNQIKRMAIHNDLLLALLSPFYFFYNGPETLIVIQTIILALGAWAVFRISEYILAKVKNHSLISLGFSISYLLYPPMQRANLFDFHAVTLSTAFLLFMFYFWLSKKYIPVIIFFILSIISKEQISLAIAFFGIYAIYASGIFKKNKDWKAILISLTLFLISAIWFALSMLVIIPLFRGKEHFALAYYNDGSLSKYIFNTGTFNYLFLLLGPLGFLSLFSPLQLLIATPEIAINLLSSNSNMRNVIYHYTSVIQPFIFVSAIYGIKNINHKLSAFFGKFVANKNIPLLLAVYILVFSLIFQYYKGPLPFMKEQNIHPIAYPQKAAEEVKAWAKKLNDEKLKIAATGQVAPHFSSRRYLYYFSKYYYMADYIVIRPGEIYNYPEKDMLIPVYEKLIKDKRFVKIYKSDNLEVYDKL